MGAHFEVLDEGVLLVPLDSRYTQVDSNLINVQVCKRILGLTENVLTADPCKDLNSHSQFPSVPFFTL